MVFYGFKLLVEFCIGAIKDLAKRIYLKRAKNDLVLKMPEPMPLTKDILKPYPEYPPEWKLKVISRKYG